MLTVQMVAKWSEAGRQRRTLVRTTRYAVRCGQPTIDRRGGMGGARGAGGGSSRGGRKVWRLRHTLE